MNVVDGDLTTVYHPLRKAISQHPLSADLSTAYNYRSRANSNIIERRFSNVEVPIENAPCECEYSVDDVTHTYRFPP